MNCNYGNPIGTSSILAAYTMAKIGELWKAIVDGLVCVSQREPKVITEFLHEDACYWMERPMFSESIYKIKAS